MHDGLDWLKQLGIGREKSADRVAQLGHIADVVKKLIHKYDVQVIHLAGSKGKGSTALFTSGTLSRLGFRVLLFTSPHVYDIKERLLLNDSPLDEVIWEKGLAKIREVLDSEKIMLGYFDVLTILAFWASQEMDCDYLILETGIGGRLDATNICSPCAVMITPIEKEHTQMLGHTLEKIALEKAAIIKPSVPVFVAKQNIQVQHVIEKRCLEQDARPLFLEDVTYVTAHELVEGNFFFNLQLDKEDYPGLSLKMPGIVQAENAVLALLCLLQILKTMTKEVIIEAWKNCIAQESLPARFEVFSSDPLIVFDGCHTVNSLEATIALWRQYVQQPSIIMFSCKEDKNWRAMKDLLGIFEEIIVTGSDPHIQEMFATIQEIYPKRTFLYSLEEDACRFLMTQRPHKPVLVAGSFYLVDKVKSIFVSLQNFTA